MLTIKDIYKKISQVSDIQIRKRLMYIMMKCSQARHKEIIANFYGFDSLMKKYCNYDPMFQKIETINYTRCGGCGVKMSYDSEKYALYCNNCKVVNYEGQFVIDKAINPNYIHQQYEPMDTFKVWVDHLLKYKTIIPKEVETNIIQAYDNTEQIYASKFGDARKFRQILRNMGLSRYNLSIASLVKLRSDIDYVPVFTDNEIKLLEIKYQKLIRVVSNLKNDPCLKKTQNVMHCRYYIVELIIKHFPQKRNIKHFVAPSTPDVRKKVQYVWNKYVDQHE